MSAVSLLNELSPLIPGMWDRSEKARFERAFIEKVGAALLDEREAGIQAAVQTMGNHPLWRTEIDALCAPTELRQRVTIEVNRLVDAIRREMLKP